MNFKKLLPISLISLGMLIGCGGDQGGGSTFPQDHEDGVHTIELNQEKLTELKAIWYDDGNARNVQDAIVSIKENGQEQNIAKAVASKKLTLAVEKEDVLAIAGMTITPKAIDAKSKACKVAVKYYDTVKSFEVTITHRKTPKEYGAKHDGTAADPMDNEDLITVAKAQKAEGDFAPVEYYAKGEVESFYKSQLPDSNQNVVSFYYKPAEGKTEKFEVYKAKYDGKPEKFVWTSQDIWVGATVTAKGKYKEYNGQFEFDPSTVLKVEGTAPTPPATIEVNVAQALAAGANLANNESTYDYYQITGLVKAIVTPFDPTSIYKQITVTMVDALTDETGVDTYRLACTDEQAAKFLYGSTLVAKGKLMKYNNNIQLAQGCEIISISGGEAWPEDKPEPTLVKGTLAQFSADTAGNEKQLYEVTGTVTKWDGENTNGTEYGNFYISDDNGVTELYVRGATATGSALVWDKVVGKYIFTNPKDFLTNEMTQAIAVGKRVTLKLTRADYNSAVQGKGIVTAVEGYEPASDAKTVAQTLAIIKALADNAETTDKYKVAGLVKEVTYNWANGTMSFDMIDSPNDAEVLAVYKLACTEEESKTVLKNASVVIEGTLLNYVGSSGTHKYEVTNGKLISATGGDQPTPVTTVTIEKGKSSSYDDNTVNGEKAIKVGKGSGGGSGLIKAPSTVSKIKFYAGGWKGNTVVPTVTVTGATCATTTLNLVACEAFTGSDKAFTVANVDTYEITLEFTNATGEITVELETTGSTNTRFLFWGAVAVTE